MSSDEPSVSDFGLLVTDGFLAKEPSADGIKEVLVWIATLDGYLNNDNALWFVENWENNYTGISAHVYLETMKHCCIPCYASHIVERLFAHFPSLIPDGVTREAARALTVLVLDHVVAERKQQCSERLAALN